ERRWHDVRLDSGVGRIQLPADFLPLHLHVLTLCTLRRRLGLRFAFAWRWSAFAWRCGRLDPSGCKQNEGSAPSKSHTGWSRASEAAETEESRPGGGEPCDPAPEALTSARAHNLPLASTGSTQTRSPSPEKKKMKLSLATLLVGSAAASSSSIKANSGVGKKLLRNARKLGGDDDGDMTWAADYSIRFEKCATSTEYNAQFYGGNGENNGGNNNNGENNGYGFYEQRLVHFKLCPTDACGSGCKGGDYVMDMDEFVQAYFEYKEEAKQAACEKVENSCYCENANDDDACLASCYITAGMYDDCVEQDNNNNNGNNNGQEEFQLEEALECNRLEVDEDAAQYYYMQNGGYNNNNNNQQAQGQQNYYYNGQNGNQNQNNNYNQEQNMEFFVGPYCSANGKSILLGVFMDEMCSYEAPANTYEKFNYGKALPYSSTSIVAHDCLSCLKAEEEDENDNNNNNNNNGNNYNYNQNQAEVIETCQQLYEAAGKCESDLQVYGMYPNTMACEFIKGMSGGIIKKLANTITEVKNATPGVLAGVFAATTVAFGGLAYYMHKKVESAKVGLVYGEGHMS
ncbi:hypothetical protein ACHAWF_011583, partial [Thalassiosira exigua]